MNVMLLRNKYGKERVRMFSISHGMLEMIPIEYLPYLLNFINVNQYSPGLSNFSMQLFILFPYCTFDVCGVCSSPISLLLLIICVFFSLSCQRLANFIDVFKEPLCFIHCFIHFSVVSFNDFCSYLYYFLLVTCYDFILLFFYKFLKCKLRLFIRDLLCFLNLCILDYKYPPGI